MFTADSKVVVQAIDNYCKKQNIKKKEFNDGSGVSSATLAQWRNEDYLVSAKSIKKIEAFTKMAFKDFIEAYAVEEDAEVEPRPLSNYEEEQDDEIMALREELRRRPETKILFHVSKNAPASAILEAAALIERYKEESKNK